MVYTVCTVHLYFSFISEQVLFRFSFLCLFPMFAVLSLLIATWERNRSPQQAVSVCTCCYLLRQKHRSVYTSPCFNHSSLPHRSQARCTKCAASAFLSFFFFQWTFHLLGVCSLRNLYDEFFFFFFTDDNKTIRAAALSAVTQARMELVSL